MAQLLFWLAVLLLLHTYVLYPILLMVFEGVAQVLAELRSIRTSKMPPRRSFDPLPTVSMVVSAYNEAECIGEKVSNSLALDYPRDRFQLLIGSDGSTDGTDEIVQRFEDPRVMLMRSERGGKPAMLNRCVPVASGEIIVFSDANTWVDPLAIQALVRNFEDPEVGAVCGRLKLYNRTKNDFEESAYWKYETMIKFFEAKGGLVVGANGGLYAIRRRLFAALPPGTIVDDFVIALRIMDEGYKVVYEPAAVAREETTGDYQREFGRRARIAAGNFQCLRWFPSLLSPAAGLRAFALWSHKVLRWCAAGLMALALIANLFLLDAPVYRVIFVLQLSFYALALAGKAGVFKGALRRLASVAYYFVTMNLAIAVGFWRFIRRSQRPAWERTARA
jgi:cellulose synthase/poly-beta-1,6-N-acetylglucosamine synthase-like glycosyltransferase